MTTLSANLPILGANNGYAKNVWQAAQALGAALFALNGALAQRRESRLGDLETAAMLSDRADVYQNGSPGYADELRHFAALSRERAAAA